MFSDLSWVRAKKLTMHDLNPINNRSLCLLLVSLFKNRRKLVLCIQKISISFQCKKQFLPPSSSPCLLQPSRPKSPVNPRGQSAAPLLCLSRQASSWRRCPPPDCLQLKWNKNVYLTHETVKLLPNTMEFVIIVVWILVSDDVISDCRRTCLEK